MLYFIGGLGIGYWLGMLMMCLLQIGKDED